MWGDGIWPYLLKQEKLWLADASFQMAKNLMTDSVLPIADYCQWHISFGGLQPLDDSFSTTSSGCFTVPRCSKMLLGNLYYQTSQLRSREATNHASHGRWCHIEVISWKSKVDVLRSKKVDVLSLHTQAEQVEPDLLSKRDQRRPHEMRRTCCTDYACAWHKLQCKPNRV